MFRLIKFLFTGDWHLHEWEIFEQGRLVDDGVGIGTWYNQRCKHCGKLKYVKLC